MRLVIGVFSLMALLTAATPARSANVAVVTSEARVSRTSRLAMESIAADVRRLLITHPWFLLVQSDAALEAEAAKRDTPRRLRRKLASARQQLNDLFVDSAARTAAALLDDVHANIDQLENIDDAVGVLSILCAITLLKDDTRSTTRYLVELLSIDPSWQPDPALFNPAMQKKLGGLRRRAVSATTVGLRVDAPVDASVYIDGKFRGLVPLNVAGLKAGPHYVRVSEPGSLSWGEVVDVPAAGARLTPTLRSAANTKMFAELRANAFASADSHADPAARAGKRAELAKLLGVSHLVLIDAGLEASESSPIHVELWSAERGYTLAKQDVARPSGGALAAVTPSELVAAVTPPRFSVVSAGIAPNPSDPNVVARAKLGLADAITKLQLRAVASKGSLDGACSNDPACVRASASGADALIAASFTPTDLDVRGRLVVYSGRTGKAVGELTFVALPDALTEDELVARGMATVLGNLWRVLEEERVAERVAAAPSPPPEVVSQSQPEPPQAHVQAPPAPAGGHRKLGLVIGGVGLAMFVGGSATAMLQGSVWGDVTSTGSAKEHARTVGTVSIVTAGVGLIATVIGGYLVLNAPPPSYFE